jgi:hypothetical protein
VIFGFDVQPLRCGAMRALLLMSILIATVAIPLWTARDPDGRRGLRRTVVHMVLFNVLYMLACVYLHHRLP